MSTFSGYSVARLSRLLWEQEVASSNLATPTLFPPKITDFRGITLITKPKNIRFRSYTVYNSNGLLETTSSYFENPMSISDGIIYFSSRTALLSLDDNGNNLRSISTSTNSQNINGIVVSD